MVNHLLTAIRLSPIEWALIFGACRKLLQEHSRRKKRGNDPPFTNSRLEPYDSRRLPGAPTQAVMATSVKDVQSRVTKAIKHAVALIPVSTNCLDQAIVGHSMLSQRGVETVIVIGLRQHSAESRPWETHAWLVGPQGILLGGGALEGFTPATIVRPGSEGN